MRKLARKVCEEIMNNRRLITERERPLTASGFRVMKGEREFITYQRDATIRVWHQPNPDSYAPHFHSAIEVCVPLLGGCEVAVSGKVYHVQAGEVLFVPSDATHALRMAAGSERYLIIFEHNAAFTMKEFAALRPMLRQPIYLTAESEATPIVRKTLMQLVDAYEAYTPLRNLRCYALLMDVFATLGELYLPNVANSAEMNDIHRRLSGEDAFNRALDYLNKKLRRKHHAGCAGGLRGVQPLHAQPYVQPAHRRDVHPVPECAAGGYGGGDAQPERPARDAGCAARWLWVDCDIQPRVPDAERVYAKPVSKCVSGAEKIADIKSRFHNIVGGK